MTQAQNVTLGLPVRTVAALLELAGRAPLFEAERLWLEALRREVGTALVAKAEPSGDAGKEVAPPE